MLFVKNGNSLINIFSGRKQIRCFAFAHDSFLWSYSFDFETLIIKKIFTKKKVLIKMHIFFVYPAGYKE